MSPGQLMGDPLGVSDHQWDEMRSSAVHPFRVPLQQHHLADVPRRLTCCTHPTPRNTVRGFPLARKPQTYRCLSCTRIVTPTHASI